MRRGDWAIGVVIGLLVIGAAGVFFFRPGASKSDLVALEKFDQPRKPAAADHSAALPPSTPPRNDQHKPVTDAPPPTVPDHSTTPAHADTQSPTTLDHSSGMQPSSPPPATHDESKPARPDNSSSQGPRDSAAQPTVTEPQPAPKLPEPARAESRPPSPAPETPVFHAVEPTRPGAPRLPVTHTVEPEDTLSGIAQRYYNDASRPAVALIMKANPELKDPNKLYAGMKLLIPDRANPTTRPSVSAAQPPVTRPRPHDTPAPGAVPATYKVQPRDTLIAIAKRFYADGRRWKDIYDLNKSLIGPNPEDLKIGAVLKLPPARPAATQPHR